MKMGRTILARPGWKVTAEGDTVYVKALDKRKACEAVEAHFSMPPGALTMDIQRHDGPLPAGEQWLGVTRPLL